MFEIIKMENTNLVKNNMIREGNIIISMVKKEKGAPLVDGDLLCIKESTIRTHKKLCKSKSCRKQCW